MSKLLKAQDAVYGGYVLAREAGVVFIRGAIPGEVVEATVEQKKKDYSIAAVTDVVRPSVFRVEPPCPYFVDCGGCQLQYASYEKQASMKNHVMLDCLRRIGRIEKDLDPPLLGPQFGYRHRAQFKVSREGAVGFYREGTRDVVPVERCLLMTEEINAALGKIARFGPAGIREAHVTQGADALIVLIKGAGFHEDTAQAFIDMGFAGVAFDDGSHRGKGHVAFRLRELEYTVSPRSFFQSNWNLNMQVIGLITEKTGEVRGKRVVDFYAGGGNFSLPLAAQGAEVVAVEESADAVKDGERNVSSNSVKKVRFIRGKAETVRLHGTFDIGILDPPRPGLTKDAMKRVLELAPERIVYVSCNPSTLARDLGKLSGDYDIESIHMVDMFPNTYHVESLAFLGKKHQKG
jgi:23S rRNA (uracil1939-C5)-methyltransferase